MTDLKSIERELRELANHALTVADKIGSGDSSSCGPAMVDIIQRRRNPIRFGNFQLRELARFEYRLRQSRHSYFNSDMFSEAGWNMLLDLLIARFEGKPVSVTSACIASMCPPTTALRWITVLVDEGLVVREEDEADRRRAFLNITDKAVELFRSYFEKSGFYGSEKPGLTAENEDYLISRGA